MRGNLLHSSLYGGPRGSIPACAGEPSPPTSPPPRTPVYPRVCGGTQVTPQPLGRPCGLSPRVRGTVRFVGAPYPAPGLSPRVRGNPNAIAITPVISGSIPACAGEPGKRTPRAALFTVYPRVCGGTLAEEVAWESAAGLSPRVRGNLMGGRAGVGSERSIPACAGEPIARRLPLTKEPVYPRVCGGTDQENTGSPLSGGLSPRVRGNLRRVALDADYEGSIPACAGEPRRSAPRTRPQNGSIPACAGEPRTTSVRPRREGVYPRVCGGTHIFMFAGMAAWGLSPRVRGNRGSAAVLTVTNWSIPACAGEPRPARMAPAMSRVYPRVCGGTSRGRERKRRHDGLSPRVRGNHLRPGDRRGRVRSIPACAGEPLLETMTS